MREFTALEKFTFYDVEDQHQQNPKENYFNSRNTKNNNLKAYKQVAGKRILFTFAIDYVTTGTIWNTTLDCSV